ncbi:hypothetical protein K438DRAFT_1781709 [Mycena galopus ATCC 62051]|nr:hypothetical protein K438DRAFT_1781709 [Mycena galopus ATCC 62051]
MQCTRVLTPPGILLILWRPLPVNASFAVKHFFCLFWLNLILAAVQSERVQELARVRALAGELFREISRKVAKTQDAGLSDYDLRDVHDEMNKQMGEKRTGEPDCRAGGLPPRPKRGDTG